MANSEYADMVFSASAHFPTQDSTCCNEATGAAPAASAQEHRSDALSSSSAVGADVVSVAPKSSRGRGGCRCWLVALVAVALIAVVAKS